MLAIWAPSVFSFQTTRGPRYDDVSAYLLQPAALHPYSLVPASMCLKPNKGSHGLPADRPRPPWGPHAPTRARAASHKPAASSCQRIESIRWFVSTYAPQQQCWLRRRCPSDAMGELHHDSVRGLLLCTASMMLTYFDQA
jgi:hypothetical protein